MYIMLATLACSVSYNTPREKQGIIFLRAQTTDDDMYATTTSP